MTFEFFYVPLALLVAFAVSWAGSRWWIRSRWVCPGKAATVRCRRLNPECTYPKCLRPRAKK